MATDRDITGIFKVGSWLLSIDTLNKEQLLKSCQDWTLDHTDILIEELNSLSSGTTGLDIELVRTSQEKVLYAVTVISKYRDIPYSPLAVGLTLIGN